MSDETHHDSLAPGQPCMPANPIYFRAALEVTLPVLQAQMNCEAAGHVDWSGAQFKVMETFMHAYDLEASEEERYSALWRAMKFFELIQEAAANPELAGNQLVIDMDAACIRIHPALLAHVLQEPLRIGEKFIWEDLRQYFATA